MRWKSLEKKKRNKSKHPDSVQKRSRGVLARPQKPGLGITYQKVISLLRDLGYVPKKRELALMLQVKGVEPRKKLKEILLKIKQDGLFQDNLETSASAKKRGLFVLQAIDEVQGPLFQYIKSSQLNQSVDKTLLYTLFEQSVLGAATAQVGDQFFGQIEANNQVSLLRAVDEDPKNLVYGIITRVDGQVYFESSDRQDRGLYRFVPKDTKLETMVGHFVLARYVPGQLPSVKLVKDIGGIDKVYDFVIERHTLPHQFSAEHLAELDEATVPDLGEREDLRALPFVTIDGEDSKDFDDAVCAELLADGNWRLWVAIADVTHYVKEGSSLDQEAYFRGNSVYFPGFVIPMLPERLSNDLCSLRPSEDRAVLCVEIIIDQQGHKQKHRFTQALIHSKARLTYEQVEEHLQGNQKIGVSEAVTKAVETLGACYQVLVKKRQVRAPLAITTSEIYFSFDAKGGVSGLTNRPQLESHRLIEEMMVLANQCAAETLAQKTIAVPFRTHEVPSQEKIAALKLFLKSLDLKSGSKFTRSADFNQLIRSLTDNPLSDVVMEMILRSQSKAIYAPENIGHFGLNLADYCHFTSPIRRYADVLVHRALIAVLSNQVEVIRQSYAENMAEWCLKISEAERRAVLAEREVSDRLAAHYFADKIGTDFRGYVSGISRVGLFVTLETLNLSGLVPMKNLADDYYDVQQTPLQLKGRRHGRLYKLGDFLSLTLAEVDLAKARLNFSLTTPKRPTNRKKDKRVT